MSSKPISVEMAEAIRARAWKALWARTETTPPDCLTIERFEHLMFETPELDRLHDCYVREFGQDYRANSYRDLPWSIPVEGGSFDFGWRITKHGYSAMRYPPGEVQLYRHRDPELYDAWFEWLGSLRRVVLETLVSVNVLYRALGYGAGGKRYPAGFITTTAQLRDTWPDLLALDRSGRAVGLVERRSRPSRVLLPEGIERWMPMVNQWLVEGAMSGASGLGGYPLSMSDKSGSVQFLYAAALDEFDRERSLLHAD